MLKLGLLHWSGLIALVAVLLSLLPMRTSGAASRPPALNSVNSPPTLGPAATQWLAQAQPGATATFLVTLADDGTQAQADGARSIGDKLQRRTEVNRLLRERAARNQAALQSFIQNQNVSGQISAVQTFAAFNGFSISATSQAVEALRTWNRVSAIELDVPVTTGPARTTQVAPTPTSTPTAATATQSQPQTFDAQTQSTGMASVQRVHTELNITGVGVTVGSLDTGVFFHSDIARQYKCFGTGSNTNCWFDALDGWTGPADTASRGTTGVGIMAANGFARGAAPDARWIACKAFNISLVGTQTDILECFDWFLAPGGNPANAPDIINNSWGFANGADTIFQQPVNNWLNAGIFPVFANGNTGPACGTVNAPASYANVLGVGAQETNTFPNLSRGPSPFGPGKPDLVAPGTGSNITSEYDISFEPYADQAFAAPHVAGVIALMLQANPNQTYEQVVAHLRNTALPVAATLCDSSGVPNNLHGAGQVRAYEAVVAAQGGTPIPIPTNTPTPTPIPPPTMPTNLVATAVSSSQVNLSWTDNSNNETGFRIERCQGLFCSNFTVIATVGANVTSFQDTGLRARTWYNYRLQSFNSAGFSNGSVATSVRTR
ncbi:MAG: S8 family serine peptidase [Chloroflexaceae bacterium]|jgi:bacillopeptidase F|nr:S8 family serine peptidase [Chloroflexaceae bacterium]